MITPRLSHTRHHTFENDPKLAQAATTTRFSRFLLQSTQLTQLAEELYPHPFPPLSTTDFDDPKEGEISDFAAGFWLRAETTRVVFATSTKLRHNFLAGSIHRDRKSVV